MMLSTVRDRVAVLAGVGAEDGQLLVVDGESPDIVARGELDDITVDGIGQRVGEFGRSVDQPGRLAVDHRLLDVGQRVGLGVVLHNPFAAGAINVVGRVITLDRVDAVATVDRVGAGEAVESIALVGAEQVVGSFRAGDRDRTARRVRIEAVVGFDVVVVIFRDVVDRRTDVDDAVIGTVEDIAARLDVRGLDDIDADVVLVGAVERVVVDVQSAVRAVHQHTTNDDIRRAGVADTRNRVVGDVAERTARQLHRVLADDGVRAVAVDLVVVDRHVHVAEDRTGLLELGDRAVGQREGLGRSACWTRQARCRADCRTPRHQPAHRECP